MKSESRNSSLHKFIAAAVIGLVLIFIVGIAVSGWQNETNDENSGDVGNNTNDADNQNGDTDDTKDGTADNNINKEDPVLPIAPKFTNYLTGTECSESQYGSIPYAFVLDPNATLYGIANSELVFEVPVEDKNTRLLMFRSDINELGKIGAMEKTRNYISVITKFFGGILVANGKDDSVTYDTPASTLHLDLSKNSVATYKENGRYVYTDNELIEAYAKDEGIDRTTLKTQALPFTFAEFGKKVYGNTSAKEIIIPYKESTSFLFNEETHKYTFNKNANAKIDMLTGTCAEFTNVFVLFADTITYELASGTQCVTNTSTGGSGYYITEGTLTEIRWRVDESGALVFEGLNSKTLTVNRGNSYVGYFKASESETVIFK
jgi:hypothetical protein